MKRIEVYAGPKNRENKHEFVGAIEAIYRASGIDKKGATLGIGYAQSDALFERVDEGDASKIVDDINKIPGLCAKIL